MVAGRLRLLPRYHLENYFLEEHVIAAVFDYLETPSNSWLREPKQIREAIREFALPFVPYGVALRIAHRLRISAGNIDLMPKQCHGLSLEELIAAFDERRTQERRRFDEVLSGTAINELIESGVLASTWCN